jgi:hypothetical protein
MLYVCSDPGWSFDRRVGARTTGMGDAFVALADDMNALNYNPAGLALERSPEFSLEYANLYYGLDDGWLQENHFAYAQGLPDFGGFGFAWNNRSLNGVYSENEFLLGYAGQPFGNLPLSAGLAVKLFYLGYSDSQTALNSYFSGGTDKYQFGLDLGVLYELAAEKPDFPRIKAGVSAIDVNQPDLGLRNEARQPLEIRAGASAAYQDWDSDVELVLSGTQPQTHVGLEKWFNRREWGVRTGVISGAGTGTTWTLGGSYAFDLTACTLRLNYSFNCSFGGIQDTAGIHRLSLDVQLPTAGASAAVPTATTAGPKAAPDAEKLARIKAYLLGRIDSYLEIARKIDTYKGRNDLGWNETVKPVESLLHEAVGQLVLNQQIIGFLHNLEEAEEHFKAIENQAPGGAKGTP